VKQVILPIWRDEFKIQVRVLKTDKAGHAVELARDTDLAGVDGLCILGGERRGEEKRREEKRREEERICA